MKKIFCLLSLVFTLISCSHSDDSQTVANHNPETLLLQKTISTNYSVNSAEVVTTLWNYNGMKLDHTTDSNGIQKNYTYTGNLITQLTEANGDVIRAYLFEYDDQGRLVTITGDIYETFEYNTDGTVTDKRYNADNALQWMATIYFNNGEISKIDKQYAGSFHTTHEYSYDNKFSLTKNIIGFDKIYLNMDYPYGNLKNVISRHYTDSDGAEGHVSKTLTYNSIGFPSTVHSTDDQFIDSYDTQFFYK